jgi:hypothetical protein
VIRHNEHLKFLGEVFFEIEIMRGQMLKKKAPDEKKEGGPISLRWVGESIHKVVHIGRRFPV